MSHPTRFQVFGMIASIQMDDVKNVIRFIEQGQTIGLLHDREWILHLTCPRVPPRQAVSREINSGTFESLCAFGSKGKLSIAFLCAPRCASAASLPIPGDVKNAWMVPNATEVRLSVRKARYILGGRRLGRRRSRYQKKDSNDYKSDGDQTTEADFHLKISFRKSGPDVSRNRNDFIGAGNRKARKAQNVHASRKR